MGNGALPNGPSYRAHPRLYPNRPAGMSGYGRYWGQSGRGSDIVESTRLTPSGHLHRHSMLRPRRANASCRTPEREQTDKLADRRRVEDAAGVPQLIETARNAELGAHAHIALIDFPVVAHVADDAHGPILGQVEFLAIIPLGADEPHNVRLLGFERLIDVLRGYPKLLGVHHRKQRPLHDQ